MNVFFEISGLFKAGSILSDSLSTAQIELPSRKRIKIKNKNILFKFEYPSSYDLIIRANEIAKKIDIIFLWECAPDEVFIFSEFAIEYFGYNVKPEEIAALVISFHNSPIYFYRKSFGKYQKALPEQIKMSIDSIDKKRKKLILQNKYEQDLIDGKLPEKISKDIITFLINPDKDSVEYKALESVSFKKGISIQQLIFNNGGLKSAYTLHKARFLYEFFPFGTDFPKINVKSFYNDLSISSVNVFSIDDISTTEIDDGFSVKHLNDSFIQIGIHIAVPALGIIYNDPIDKIARSRLSTVYIPGSKITMLPDNYINIFTLKENNLRPVLSLYVRIDKKTQNIISTETRLEKVFISHNLRYNKLDKIITKKSIISGSGNYLYKDDIKILWIFAKNLFEKRQKNRINYGLKRDMQDNIDYNFYVKDENISIIPRKRSIPLNLIVTELAIFTNASWAKLLYDYKISGIYRVQYSSNIFNSSKKAKMQITAARHEELGVSQYAWSASPLRRYIDLVNQRLILTCIMQKNIINKNFVKFRPKDIELYNIIYSFNKTYLSYYDFQKKMEFFWCLCWLKQEKKNKIIGLVIKDNLVLIEEIPLLLHVISLGIHEKGTRVLLEIISIDELEISISVKVICVLNSYS